MTPTVRHVSTPTLPGPVPPPPYSPPSPVYHPDPTPSPAGTNVANTPVVGGNLPGNCSGGSVIIDPGCPRPGMPVFKTQSMLTLRKVPQVRNDQKLWQKIQVSFPKNFSGFVKMLQRILVHTVNL